MTPIQKPYKRIISTLLFLIGAPAIYGQRLYFEDYFPLKNGSVISYDVYRITNQDTVQKEPEKAFCKSLFVKGKEIFYFDDLLISEDTTIIGSQSFCHGVFFYEHSKFVYSPIFWKYDLINANLDYFETLFPEYIVIDSVYKTQDGAEKRSYRFNGFEDVSIKDKQWKDCLKLTITSDWITEKYIDFVWFKKGIGVVKWLRSTGRLEELKL